MLIKLVVFLLIAYQIEYGICMPLQSQFDYQFNNTNYNPYYNNNNNGVINPYSPFQSPISTTTTKSLYPTLYPQLQPVPPYNPVPSAPQYNPYQTTIRPFTTTPSPYNRNFTYTPPTVNSGSNYVPYGQQQNPAYTSRPSIYSTIRPFGSPSIQGGYQNPQVPSYLDPNRNNYNGNFPNRFNPSNVNQLAPLPRPGQNSLHFNHDNYLNNLPNTHNSNTFAHYDQNIPLAPFPA